MANKHATPAKSSVFHDGKDGLKQSTNVNKTTLIQYNRAKCLGEDE